MIEWGTSIYGGTTESGARGVIDDDALSRMAIFQTTVGCPGTIWYQYICIYPTIIPF